MNYSAKVFVLFAIIVFFTPIIFREQISRKVPGLPSYYSFYDHPFTYKNMFTDGKVGEFGIGMNKKELIRLIAESKTTYNFSMAASPSQLNDFYFNKEVGVTASQSQFLMNHNSWRLVSKEFGAVVVYTINFKDDVVDSISLTSTLVS